MHIAGRCIQSLLLLQFSPCFHQTLLSFGLQSQNNLLLLHNLLNLSLGILQINVTLLNLISFFLDYQVSHLLSLL
jgi:hypothetical protein